MFKYLNINLNVFIFTNTEPATTLVDVHMYIHYNKKKGHKYFYPSYTLIRSH